MRAAASGDAEPPAKRAATDAAVAVKSESGAMAAPASAGVHVKQEEAVKSEPGTMAAQASADVHVKQEEDAHGRQVLSGKKLAKQRENAKRKEQRLLLRSVAQGGRACCTRFDLIAAVAACVNEDGTFDADGRALALLAAWRLRMTESRSSAKQYSEAQLLQVTYLNTHTAIAQIGLLMETPNTKEKIRFLFFE